ncbi:hypothetical protein AXF42_Ash000745 [Apostasia shenzhenica]|uniref:Uncharacterized protein n=1 Tax=Apostasia shenzhenica TaxID=1088818 RepID=A0A2I0AH63_9ASPA|nr:hypothetical protein AXF42_Ash000745 [Apostasia shenzhenica]
MVALLLRSLEPSEAEKAIADQEWKCARYEGDLAAATLEIEVLKKEKTTLEARAKELVPVLLRGLSLVGFIQSRRWRTLSCWQTMKCCPPGTLRWCRPQLLLSWRLLVRSRRTVDLQPKSDLLWRLRPVRTPGIGSGGLTAQTFVRNTYRPLHQIEGRSASGEQMAALEWKVDEALTLLQRLEPSEAEKATVDLESKCARYEGNLEAVTLKIEVLKKDKIALEARVEELVPVLLRGLSLVGFVQSRWWRTPSRWRITKRRPRGILRWCSPRLLLPWRLLVCPRRTVDRQPRYNFLRCLRPVQTPLRG